MSTASLTPAPEAPAPPPMRGLAAFLSFAVPGLGQILQGIVTKNNNRLSKGVFFLVVLLGMFMTGMYLGHGKNVYLPQLQAGLPKERKLTWFGRPMPELVADGYTRLQYVGQFWIGVAAWPALWNYCFPDAAIMETYYGSPGAPTKGEPKDRDRLFIDADQEASDLQFQLDKTWDIGWIYTVIAGVLNILVIYDAWAGPVIPRPAPAKEDIVKGDTA